MATRAICAFLLMTTACGYKILSWQSGQREVLWLSPVTFSPTQRDLGVRLEEFLLERCHSGTSLDIVRSGESFDLHLKSELRQYDEQVVATDLDGRTRRLQFSIRLSFVLEDRQGVVLWRLSDYELSDQYELTTRLGQGFRDEKVATQEQALRKVADLVASHLTLALADRQKDS
jgi:hypothetical protein